MTQTLVQYLEIRAAEIQAWVAQDPANRCGFTYVTDAAHWADLGIHTVEEFELYEAQSQYSDLFKDVYGCRPRGNFPKTLEEYASEMESLQQSLELEIENEREYVEYVREYEEEEYQKNEITLMELSEYEEGRVWANYQDGWI